MIPATSPYSTRKLRPWQETVFAAALLWLLCLVFFWPQAVQGRALYWGDIGLYFGPMLSFLHSQLQVGRLPLWNPYILCGTPYVGNPQTWPLYPFSFLLRALDAQAFINATIFFHVWFAALGTFLFLRHAGGRTVGPALLGAVVFACGGQLVSKEQFPNMVQAASYLPWVLWMTQRLATRNRIGDALSLGLVLGLQLLAAHAQMTLLTLYLSAAYGVWLLSTQKRLCVEEWRRLALGVLLVGAVAFGLAAGQLLPTTELFRDAWRQKLSFSVVDRFYLPGNQLGNFVLPTLHGHPLYGDFTARGNFWETCCFVGWVAFALALFGVWCACWRAPLGDGRFWTGAALVGLLLALGGQTWRGARATNGLYWVAYHVLPGFRNFHDPARCLLWSSFALAALAALGLENVSPGLKSWAAREKTARFRGRGRIVRAVSTSFSSPTQAGSLPSIAQDFSPVSTLVNLILIAGCFAELLHFGRTIYPLADPATLHPVSPLVARLQAEDGFRAHQARFLAPDSARVWQRFTTHRSYRQSVGDYQSLWAETMTPNLMMGYGLADAYGYEPVMRRDTQTIAGMASQSFTPSATPSEKANAATWAGLLSVRDVVTLRVRAPARELSGLSPLASEPTLAPLGARRDPARLYLSRNEHWQPRARLMTDFRSVDTTSQASSLTMRPSNIDLNTTLVLIGRVPFPAVPGKPVPATITRDDPDRVEVSAQTTAPAVLVLADTRHPGWRVTVNGVPTPLLTADACLRAVPLPKAGRCHVVFTDLPTSFVLGLYLSLLTLGTLVGAATFALSARRK